MILHFTVLPYDLGGEWKKSDRQQKHELTAVCVFTSKLLSNN